MLFYINTKNDKNRLSEIIESSLKSSNFYWKTSKRLQDFMRQHIENMPLFE